MRTSTAGNTPAYTLDRSLDFLRLLWNVEHGLQSASKRMEVAMGITGPQRLALRIVSRFPGISVTALADVLHLHPSTISGILHRLVVKGWLAREDDPADRRRRLLRVKGEGHRFTAHDRNTVEAAVGRALARMPAGHLKHAREVLWAIAGELDSTSS